VVECLRDTRDLYCYFSNPNIDTPEEYEKRRAEADTVARRYNVPFASPPYAPGQWETAVAGYRHTPEGGQRCTRCFLLRLRDTARFCKEIGWSAFASVMSISPHKSVAMLDEAGSRAAEEYGVAYEGFNFKKKDGFRRSVELSKELGLYRQDYCGCRLSREESMQRAAHRRTRDEQRADGVR
jgi:predicted adenine nucleotide alpha hydrolase (AANH) superfamily ATPase